MLVDHLRGLVLYVYRVGIDTVNLTGLEPDVMRAFCKQLGDIYAEEGSTNAALATYSLGETEPNYKSMALGYIKKDKPNEARDIFVRAKDLEGLIGLSDRFVKTGDLITAVDILLTAVDIYEEKVPRGSRLKILTPYQSQVEFSIREKLSYVANLVQDLDPDRAFECYFRAFNRIDANSLANGLFENGNYEKALDYWVRLGNKENVLYGADLLMIDRKEDIAKTYYGSVGENAIVELLSEKILILDNKIKIESEEI